MVIKPKRVAIIGGGTGTFVVTQALKATHNYDISKIVAVFDSGGSTARLRDEFGFLPVGDLRQSLAAMAQDASQEWIQKLLLYRFDRGQGLKGHNLGNLILTALQDMTGSTPKALDVASSIFRLNGKVLPVTTTAVDLKITYEDGQTVIGEHLLDEPKNGGRKIASITLTKPCQLYDQARDTILESDFIIVGPGDLYASLVPNFLVDGIKPALKTTKAKIIFVVNLMTRYTQTHQYTAQDHLDTIERYLGRPVDFVLINSAPIPPTIAKKYEKFHEYPVIDNLSSSARTKIIRSDFAGSVPIKKQPGDIVPRALIRHDQAKLLKSLLKLL